MLGFCYNCKGDVLVLRVCLSRALQYHLNLLSSALSGYFFLFQFY